jgi:outer membrane protein OmpA-like peptidoglycan-associated protein
MEAKSWMMITLIACNQCWVSAVEAQETKVKKYSFYFDTNVDHQLKDAKEIVFTDADDQWLNGTITEVKVLGYADCQGSPDYNLALSKRRASYVAKSLKNLMTLPKEVEVRIISGGELPCIVDSKLGDAENRRVDVEVNYLAKEVVELKNETKVISEKIKNDGMVDLVGVNFQPGRHFFLPGVEAVLDQFALIMQSEPSMKIKLRGHICCQPEIGDGPDLDTGLNNLSEARAKAVFDYLVLKGVAPERMKYVGVGNRHPKFWPELTIDDQIGNRRVEAVLWE